MFASDPYWGFLFYAVLFISFIYFSFVVSLGCMTVIPPVAKITKGGILKLRHSVREQRSHRWKKVTKADMGRRDVMRKVMSLAQNFFLLSDGVLMVSQQAKWKWMKIMKIRLRGLYNDLISTEKIIVLKRLIKNRFCW